MRFGCPDSALGCVDYVAVAAEPAAANAEGSIEDEHVNLELAGSVGGLVDLQVVELGEGGVAQELILYVLHVIEEELELRSLHLLAEG